jgi:3-deoxy-D-manno-octulosonic-acid transferase
MWLERSISWGLNAVYSLLLLAASPWMIYQSLRYGKYREGWHEKLLGCVPERLGSKDAVWFHAVSVGELQLLRPLIREFQQRWPDWEIVLSTTTVTGRKLARDSYPELITFYCPFDFTWGLKRALNRLRPRLLILAELELWPNLISLAHRRGVEIAIVNGRLSERSFKGYSRIRFLTRSLLSKLDCIAVQNSTYAERFIQLGARPEHVHVTGSIKFDGANSNRQHVEVLQRRKWAGLGERDTVWVVGSTQEPEEVMATEIYLRLQEDYSSLKLIVVPRHAERFDEVYHSLLKFGIRVVRRSAANQESAGNWDVLLIDTIGELRWWWGVANFATVGGSFGNRGGQNMIEPCAYGACVSFGPNTRNFRDIVRDLLQWDLATQVADASELESWLLNGLKEPLPAIEQGKRAAAWVGTHLGATKRTSDLLAPFIEFVEKPGKAGVSRDAA